MIRWIILGAAMLAGLAGGYRAGAIRWQSKYEALMSQNWEARATRESAIRQQLERQLAESQRATKNNAEVLDELRTRTDTILRDRDRALDQYRRLLAGAKVRAATDTHRQLPEADDQPRVAHACPAGIDERAAKLLADASVECRLNAEQLDALIAQIKPQCVQ